MAALHLCGGRTQCRLHTAQNKGREANAYLTYIVDKNDQLPDFSVFLHANRDGHPAA